MNRIADVFKGFLAVLVLSAPVFAQSIAITSPTASQSVSGIAFTFTSTPASLPSEYSVEYQVNSETACIATTPPFSCSWNTFYWFGGPASAVAIARNALNATIATSSAVSFTVANQAPEPAGDSASWSISLSQTPPVSGDLKITGTFTGSPRKCSANSVYIDGNPISESNLNNSATSVTFSTSLYDNGNHYVVAVCADSGIPSNAGWDQVAQYEQVVDFENGAVPMELRMGANEVFLCTTTQTLCPTSYTFSPILVNTDESSAAATSMQYFSSNTSVATVSVAVVTQVGIGNSTITGISGTQSGTDLTIQIGGFVSSATPFVAHDIGDYLYISAGSGCNVGLYQIVGYGVGNGWATLSASPGTVSSVCTWVSGPSGTANVYVNTQNVLPHFLTNGTVSTSYVAPNGSNPSSIYFCSMFTSSGPFGDPNYPKAFTWAADYAASGCNTIETGVLSNNPSESQGQSAWQTQQASYVSSQVAQWQPYGLYTHLVGTALTVSNDALWVATHSPAAGVAVSGQTTWTTPMVQTLATGWAGIGSPGVLGITGGDEVNGFLGQSPLQCVSTSGCFIGQNGFSQISCVNSGVCTVNYTNWSLRGNEGGSFYFIITGSGNTSLDYNTTSGCAAPYTATSIDANDFSFPTPAGVGTATFTSGSNPSLQIQPYVYGAVDTATWVDGPHGGSSTGPCSDYVRYDAISSLLTTFNGVSGAPLWSWPVLGSSGGIAVSNWEGDPRVSQVGESYFSPDTGYLPQRFSTFNIVSSIGGTYRSKYALLGNSFNGGIGNRLAPILGEGQGTTATYGMQGYNVAVTSLVNGLMTFSAPHGLVNIIPWSTRLWLLGSSGLTGNYYVINCPSTTTCWVAQAMASNTTSLTGLTGVTATFQDGSTNSNITTLKSSTSNFKGSSFAVSGALPISKQGQQITFSGASAGIFANYTWVYIYPQFGTSASMAQLPLGSATGGTATIVASNAYYRGINIPGPTGSDAGARYMFAAYDYYKLLGAGGVRIYQENLFDNLDDPNGPTGITANFQDTGSQTWQAGLHPRYQYGPSELGWQANAVAIKMDARDLKYSLQPRLPSPDYGKYFQSTLRQGSYGNYLHVESFADGTLTRTIDLSTCAVTGQQTIKYSYGWKGIAVSTIAAGVISDTAVFDPDNAASISYICSNNAAAEYSPPVISARLADVTNAAQIVVQYSYTPGLFSSPQVNLQALPLSSNCGSGAACVLPVDRNIGVVYYRLIYLDSTGKVLATSDVQTF